LKGERWGPRNWRFLTNHALVLIVIARSPDARITDIARSLGITERAVQRIISELVEAGHVERHKTGRRNRYEIVRVARFRDPPLRDREIGSLLDALLPESAMG
jgi:DNA-binding IclR family transcriptional regulator